MIRFTKSARFKGTRVAGTSCPITYPLTLLLAVALLLGGFGLYGQFGKGITFFPSVEPDFMQVQVRARDNFSIFERDALVRAVEERILGYDEIQYLRQINDERRPRRRRNHRDTAA